MGSEMACTATVMTRFLTQRRCAHSVCPAVCHSGVYFIEALEGVFPLLNWGGLHQRMLGAAQKGSHECKRMILKRTWLISVRNCSRWACRSRCVCFSSGEPSCSPNCIAGATPIMLTYCRWMYMIH